MSWRNIIKRELYPLASRKELARSPMVRQQMEDALSQVQIDENYDPCCENARNAILTEMQDLGVTLRTSDGIKLNLQESLDHIRAYDCKKLREFAEYNVTKIKGERKEFYRNLLDDWDDCEGE